LLVLLLRVNTFDVFLEINETLSLLARRYLKWYVDWVVSKNDSEQGRKANGSPPALEINSSGDNDQPNDSPDDPVDSTYVTLHHTFSLLRSNVFVSKNSIVGGAGSGKL